MEATVGIDLYTALLGGEVVIQLLWWTESKTEGKTIDTRWNKGSPTW